MSGLMQKMMETNLAPGWFYLDMQKGLPSEDILQKMQIELQNEVINRGYDMNLWSEGFVRDVAKKYYSHFEKLYHMSITSGTHLVN